SSTGRRAGPWTMRCWRRISSWHRPGSSAACNWWQERDGVAWPEGIGFLRPRLVDRDLRTRPEARDHGMRGLESAPERGDCRRLGDLDGDRPPDGVPYRSD